MDNTKMYLEKTGCEDVNWTGTSGWFLCTLRGCIQKFPDCVNNEINNKNNKHSLRSNTKGYGAKTH